VILVYWIFLVARVLLIFPSRVWRDGTICTTLETRLWYVHVLHLEYINEVSSCTKLVNFPDLIFSHICSLFIHRHIFLADLT
jgi:hypothetical protein